MRNWSITVGRLFGVELRIHVTFILLLLFVLLTDAAAPHGASPARGLALVGIIFGSVILHELGHAMAARHFGVAAKAVVLLPLGGLTMLDESRHTNADWKREIRFAAAGRVGHIEVSL